VMCYYNLSIGFERTNEGQRIFKIKSSCKSKSEEVKLWWQPRSWCS